MVKCSLEALNHLACSQEALLSFSQTSDEPTHKICTQSSTCHSSYLYMSAFPLGHEDLISPTSTFGQNFTFQDFCLLFCRDECGPGSKGV